MTDVLTTSPNLPWDRAHDPAERAQILEYIGRLEAAVRVNAIYKDAFTDLFKAVAACQAPEGTRVDDVLEQFQVRTSNTSTPTNSATTSTASTPAPTCS